MLKNLALAVCAAAVLVVCATGEEDGERRQLAEREEHPMCHNLYLYGLPPELIEYSGVYTTAQTLNGRPYYVHESSTTNSSIMMEYVPDKTNWYVIKVEGNESVSTTVLKGQEDTYTPLAFTKPWSMHVDGSYMTIPFSGSHCVDCASSKAKRATEAKKSEATDSSCHDGHCHGHGETGHHRRLMEDGEEDEDWSEGINWNGAMVIDTGVYTLTADRTEGCFAQPASKAMVIIKPLQKYDSCDHYTLDEHRDRARAGWYANVTDVVDGDDLEDGMAHMMVFNQRTYSSQFNFIVDKASCVMLFTQWGTPKKDYKLRVMDVGGNAIPYEWTSSEPRPVEFDEDAYETAKWDVFPEALLAVCVCTLPTLLGIFMLIPVFKKFENLVPTLNAFAGGVLAGAAFLHLYPEGMQMLTYTDPVEVMWKSGTAAILGCSVGFFLELLFPPADHVNGGGAAGGQHAPVPTAANLPDVEPPEGKEDLTLVAGNATNRSSAEYMDDQATMQEDIAKGKLVFRKHDFCDLTPVSNVAWNLCLGDACHNIIDGVMIGAAFAACDTGMGWVLTGAILAHELPQEIGDFFLLMNAGMSLSQALFWNVFSGMTAVAGLVVVFSLQLSSTALGSLMIFGAGVFVYISFSNLVPVICREQDQRRKYMQVIAYFVGVFVLGLTVGAHAHCEMADGSPLQDLHGHAHRL